MADDHLHAGTMNIMWMAALTLFAFIEKTASGPVTSRLGGTIVTALGAALLAGNLIVVLQASAARRK